VKVAIVHDWCVTYGGAERVLERIIDLFPTADLFSLIDKVPLAQRHFMRGKIPTTSFLQKIPGIERHYRKLLALMPHAIEQFDLAKYDLIISSHYSVAKGVITAPRQIHVCYCHSPMRYAWDMQHSALADSGLDKGIKGVLARWQLHHIRQWDARTANNVDLFIANSNFVADRIWRCYRRESVVIPPPVDVGAFSLKTDKSDYYVSVGRIVPYKKIDILVDAFRGMPDKRLIVVGDGPLLESLRRGSPSNVSFLGRQPFSEMRDMVANARALLFPAYEDFGIVPLEAQASGTPVIAFGSGGALETVVSATHPQDTDASDTRPKLPPTGLYFYEQSSSAVRDAILRFEQLPADLLNANHCRAHALAFNCERFDEQFRTAIERGLTEGRPSRPTRAAVHHCGE
jgi:glycosyltransferase involved in cell wall biosynthesis